MRWQFCSACQQRMGHGFPYQFGGHQHLLCGDCRRLVEEGKLPYGVKRKPTTSNPSKLRIPPRPETKKQHN